MANTWGGEKKTCSCCWGEILLLLVEFFSFYNSNHVFCGVFVGFECDFEALLQSDEFQ